MRAAIWVTRTEPFSRLTAKKLTALGYEPLTAPAMRIVPIPASKLLAVPDAIIFTSLQGVRHHTFLPALAHIPVFAVGDRTARFARGRGYKRVISAQGDLHDLARMLRGAMDPGSEILQIGAVRPSGDLAAMLRPAKVRVRRLQVYDAVEADPADLEWMAGRLEEIGWILIYSPRAGHHVARWLSEQAPGWSGEILCISPAAALPFRALPRARVRTAKRPNEADLLEPLVRLSLRSATGGLSDRAAEKATG